MITRTRQLVYVLADVTNANFDNIISVFHECGHELLASFPSVLRGRILQVLNAVKFVPNAATASESEALAWLMSRPPQLSALARAARCSVPATCADIER